MRAFLLGAALASSPALRLLLPVLVVLAAAAVAVAVAVAEVDRVVAVVWFNTAGFRNTPSGAALVVLSWPWDC